MALDTSPEAPVPVRTILRLTSEWIGRLGRVWVEGQIAELTRRGNTVFLTVKTFAPGRISGSGGSLATVYRHLRTAANATTLKVPLSSRGQRRGRPFSTRVRVGFLPSRRGESTSTAFVTVSF